MGLAIGSLWPLGTHCEVAVSGILWPVLGGFSNVGAGEKFARLPPLEFSNPMMLAVFGSAPPLLLGKCCTPAAGARATPLAARLPCWAGWKPDPRLAVVVGPADLAVALLATPLAAARLGGVCWENAEMAVEPPGESGTAAALNGPGRVQPPDAREHVCANGPGMGRLDPVDNSPLTSTSTSNSPSTFLALRHSFLLRQWSKELPDGSFGGWS